MSILCLACTRAQIWLSTAHQDQRMSIVGPFLPLSQKKCLSFQLLVFHFHFSPVFPSLSSDERRQGNKIKLVLRSNMQLSTCRQRRQVKQENGCTILASTICIFHCTPPPQPPVSRLCVVQVLVICVKIQQVLPAANSQKRQTGSNDLQARTGPALR